MNDKLYDNGQRRMFANLMRDAVRRTGDRRRMEYDAGDFELFVTATPGTRIHLHNAYDEYRSAPAACRDEILRRWAANWASSSTWKELIDIDEARLKLLPMICDRSSIEFESLRARLSKGEPPRDVSRVIAPDLAMGLVYDQPETFRWIRQADLSSWGLGFNDAIGIATENLRRRSASDFERLGAGTYRSPWRDSYDASRLILLDRIQNLDVRGRHVAIVPNRDTLLITGSDDASGLNLIVKEAIAALHAPRFMTGAAMTLSGEEWVPYLPASDSPSRHDFKGLRDVTYRDAYAAQADLLRKLGGDAFVAKYMVGINKRTGEPLSVCIWTQQSVPVLLPRTDRICFVDADLPIENGGLMAGGHWDDVVAVVGDLMHPQGLHPERYLVERNPSPEQMRALPQCFDGFH